jgi:phospholipase/carboxylesterase
MSMFGKIDGPRLAPASGKADALVVFLHGYGADGNDLLDIGRHWQRALPGCAFVSPHAPEPCGNMPMGRQWFPLTMRDPTEYWRGTSGAAPGLDAFLDGELARLGLGAERLVLVGFSQGTMMALHVGLRRQRGPAAIVGYSGMLAGPEHLGSAPARPPILLVHGDMDDVIPAQMMMVSADALAKAGHAVQWHLSRGLPHSIDPEGLDLGQRFIQAALKAR